MDRDDCITGTWYIGLVEGGVYEKGMCNQQ